MSVRNLTSQGHRFRAANAQAIAMEDAAEQTGLWWMALVFATACLWASTSHAINYDDPNLSAGHDAAARAALSCSAYRNGSADEFKRCLIANGVTEPNEQKDAIEQARSLIPDTTLNITNFKTQAADDVVTSNDGRLPASAHPSASKSPGSH